MRIFHWHFVKPWSSVVCPFCFKRFHVGACHFRCANPDQAECPKQEDKEFSRHMSKGKAQPVKMQQRRAIPPRDGAVRRLLARWVMPMRSVA